MQPTRVTSQQIIDAYQATGSVWRAGKSLGITGQTVHDRLRALQYPLAGRHWSPDEVQELRSLYSAAVPLGEIAQRLGRPYAGVACKASELGLKTTPVRQRKAPRGAGWDKVSTRHHLDALTRYPGKITAFARMHGLSLEMLVQAIQRHFPDEWHAYVERHSDMPRKTCPYCEGEFVPANGKQIYCDRHCADRARRDRTYFGGKRRSTPGLADGICQLCGKEGMRGLSSHHVLGKENDAENDFLIAICQGCHKLVSMLGGRSFVDDEAAWESLISLAWLRKHGAQLASGEMPHGTSLHVTVDIDVYVDDEEVVAS